jgi:hypothetical protein
MFHKKERNLSKEKSHTLTSNKKRKFLTKKRLKNISPNKCMIIKKPKPVPLINSNSNSNLSYHSSDYYEQEDDTVVIDSDGNEKVIPSPRQISKKRKLRAYNKKLEQDFINIASPKSLKKTLSKNEASSVIGRAIRRRQM